MKDTLSRFIGVFIAGLVTLMMVMGSFGLAKLDPALVFTRPTRVAQIPTATLYPTVASGVTPIPSTATSTVPPTATLPATLTPSSPLLEQCKPPAGWLPYVVTAKDTFVTLAWKAGTTAYYLMRANCLGAPEIKAGDIIYLPPFVVVSPTAAPFVCGPPLHWKLTVVRAGDTLFSLARRYGTSVEEIRRANCMVGIEIYAGQRLYLPPIMVITPTWTPYPTLMPTALPTITPTWTYPTLTATPTGEATITLTPSVTITPTETPTTPTVEPITPTPTPDIILTPEPSPTFTSTPSTPSPTPTPRPSPSTPTSTFTPPAASSSPTPTTLTTYPPTATQEAE